MSGRQSSDNLENLFSFELLVECIRIEKQPKVSDELALGVRLLDFSTLLIYQPQRRSGHINKQEQNVNEKPGEYAFNRGKSCFFKMNLNSLHTHLSSIPLYAMVLDVKEEIPKLVGSSMISLANVVDRISQDVAEHGVSTPSSHGERGLVYISNLTGEKIGSISLSYKLLSLGAILLPHIGVGRDLKSVKVHRGQPVQECHRETNISTESLTPDCSPTLERSDIDKTIQSNRLANAKVITKENEQDDDAVCVDTKHKPEILEEGENNLTIFCPPYLYYTNSGEEKTKIGDFKLLNLDPEAFTLEDSEDETAQNELEGPSSPVMHQQVRQNAPMSSNQKTSGLSPNVLGEALQQLPLLNALLVELSLLHGQNPHQPLSVHPNLSWIYRPDSTEPSARHGNATLKAQVKSLQKTEHLKNVHAPRNCSTPILSPASVKKKDRQEEALIESKSSNKCLRKKLVYGTTKTFNLRLKQISPALKRRECMELVQNDTKSSVAKGKIKPCKKSSKRKSVLNQSSSLHENIETMIQSVTVDSTIQETVTIKQKSMHGKVHGKQDRDSQTISEQRSLSERDLKFIHIPTVNSDSVARNKDENEHHSESNQSWSESDRHGKKIESSGSSSHSSPKSSFSNSSGEGNEEADYADDFNSLEPSDAYSPDPMSSPEPSRAKTPKSPACPSFSNSDPVSESVQKRTVLPVPIKAPSSPQRALRGTYVIRPKTQASVLSFSSDDDNRDGSVSLQSSRKKMTNSIRLERTSGAESFLSYRGERSESTKTSGPVQEFSADSVSSFGLQEAEEVGDELGSLDFRKEYQHISELVANKLPGYTM